MKCTYKSSSNTILKGQQPSSTYHTFSKAKNCTLKQGAAETEQAEKKTECISEKLGHVFYIIMQNYTTVAQAPFTQGSSTSI